MRKSILSRKEKAGTGIPHLKHLLNRAGKLTTSQIYEQAKDKLWPDAEKRALPRMESQIFAQRRAKKYKLVLSKKRKWNNNYYRSSFVNNESESAKKSSNDSSESESAKKSSNESESANSNDSSNKHKNDSC